MAITPAPIDELSISMIQAGDITITAGTAKVVVTACLGTRDDDNRFTWSRKIRLELYPDSEGDYPTDEQGRPLPHIRLIPPNFLLDLRAALLAIEAYLQAELDEVSTPIPERVSQARARFEHTDPRMELAWRTIDGHNAAPGHTQVQRRCRQPSSAGGGNGSETVDADPDRLMRSGTPDGAERVASAWRELIARLIGRFCDGCPLPDLCEEHPGICPLAHVRVDVPGTRADVSDEDLIQEVRWAVQALG